MRSTFFVRLARLIYIIFFIRAALSHRPIIPLQLLHLGYVIDSFILKILLSSNSYLLITYTIFYPIHCY